MNGYTILFLHFHSRLRHRYFSRMYIACVFQISNYCIIISFHSSFTYLWLKKSHFHIIEGILENIFVHITFFLFELHFQGTDSKVGITGSQVVINVLTLIDYYMIVV